MKPSSTYSGRIKDEALRLGFSDCGISRAGVLTGDFNMLQLWLDKQYNARLDYMQKNKDKREDITRLVEGAKSVISVILNYFPSKKQEDPEAPVLARYAYGRDYHKVMKPMLTALLNFIRHMVPGSTGRVFVDSAPVMEHAWAVRGGLGWIGKHSLLISRHYGSFVFIGEVVTDIELEYDIPGYDMCGSCTKCISACPTEAIMENRLIDANRCISFHTIENKTDDMPSDLKDRFMNRVFGCDICQDVCPWNKNSKPHHIPEFDPGPELMEMKAEDWHAMEKTRFDELFRHSAVKRAKFRGLRRNLTFLK